MTGAATESFDPTAGVLAVADALAVQHADVTISVTPACRTGRIFAR